MLPKVDSSPVNLHNPPPPKAFFFFSATTAEYNGESPRTLDNRSLSPVTFLCQRNANHLKFLRTPGELKNRLTSIKVEKFSGTFFTSTNSSKTRPTQARDDRPLNRERIWK